MKAKRSQVEDNRASRINEPSQTTKSDWDFLKTILKQDVEGLGSWIIALSFAKHYLLCIVIMSLLEYPGLQIILSLIICVALGVISIKSRPFNLTSKNIMLITTDIVAVLSLLIFLLIHLLDENTLGVTISEREKYLYIGNVLLCIILASLTVSMVTGVFEVVRSSVIIIRGFLENKSDKTDGNQKEVQNSGEIRGDRDSKFIKSNGSRGDTENLKKRRKFPNRGLSESGMGLRDKSGLDDPENLNDNDDEIIIHDVFEQGKKS